MRTLQAAPRTYMLCTSPRSGSTMLCGMLAATGVAGAPQSYFHRPDISSWARGMDLPDNAPLADIISAVHGTGTHGLTGIRLQDHSRAFLMDKLAQYGPTDPQRIEAAFGPTRYIWLRRTDKLAQAISVLRAEQTGLWHGNADGTDLERITPSRDDGYDAEAITAQINAFTASDRTWLNWFSTHGITPWSLTYETLVDDPQTSLRMILIHLGLDQDIADDITPPTRKLADATSDNWTARYRADVLAKGGDFA
ncbi:Stf0 family sulfotransferase [uncultured Tateyamaria sp.]|uniref:Stf0 family sulfotransferase n=1 Tax=uncultured Tateyamaria sp. TaxID=455651 RepID=UPI00262A0EE6|nr:Stf0 family sulfotransferase [uncultured Tateyamaria sp.]